MIENTIQNFRRMRQEKSKAGQMARAKTQQRLGLAQRQVSETDAKVDTALRRAKTEQQPTYDPAAKIEEWYSEIEGMRAERANREQSTTGAMDENPLATPRPRTFTDSVDGETGARLVSDLQEELGLTREQAAGFVGNLHVETGGFKFMQEIEPIVPGSRGGLGFAQWTGPRRVAFEEWAAENGMDTRSYEANKGFLLHEINNTSEGRFMDELREATTAEDAAMVVSNKFLRPGIPHNERRVAIAQQYTRGE